MNGVIEADTQTVYGTRPTERKPLKQPNTLPLGVESEKTEVKQATKGREQNKRKVTDEKERQRLLDAWEKALKKELSKKAWADAQQTIKLAVDMGLEPQTVTSKPRKDEKPVTAAEVVKNAVIESDEERLKRAKEVLGREKLTEKEEKAIIKAHNVGIDEKTGEREKGKDEEHDVSVFNKSVGQLKRTVEALEEAVDEQGNPTLSREEQRKLIEAGIAAPALAGTYTEPTVAGLATEYTNLLNTAGGPGNPLNPRSLERLVTRTAAIADNSSGARSAAEQAEARALMGELETAFNQDNPRRPDRPEGLYTILTPEDFRILQEGDMRDWVNYRMTQLYAIAGHADVAQDNTFKSAQQAFEEALRYKGVDVVSQKELGKEFKARTKLLIMASALATKEPDSYVGAARGLRTEHLLNGYTLEGGKIASLANRIDEMIEDERLKQSHQHITNDILVKVQDQVIKENLDNAFHEDRPGHWHGLGDFADIADPTNRAVNKQMRDAKNNEGIFREQWDAIDAKPLSAAEKDDELRREIVKAEIINAYQAANDIVVSNLRLAVMASRSMQIRSFDPDKRGQGGDFEDSLQVWASDPSFPFMSFNARKAFLAKWNFERPADFEMYEEMTKSLVSEYMDKYGDKGFGGKPLTDHEKTQLGDVLFRDMLAPGDFLSSSWRLEGLMGQMEDYFAQPKFAGRLKDEKGKNISAEEYKKNFALFMRLCYEDNKPDLWRRIAKYRPEEVIKLLREKFDHGGEVEAMQREIFGSDHGYDHFKEHYGYGIRMIRERAFRGDYTAARDAHDNVIPGTGLAEQVDFTKLTARQKAELNAMTHNQADEVIKAFEKMQKYIDDHYVVPKDENDNSNKSRVDADPRFAELYKSGQPRARVVDDALIGTLQSFERDGRVKLSDRMGGAIGYEGDSYARCVGDISAGEGEKGVIMTMLAGIQATDMENKFKAFQAAAKTASTYAAMDGTAKILYHTEVPYLLAAKLPLGWDLLGVEKHPIFRKPINRLQEIYGPHADAFSQDRLRHELDIIETSLELGISHAIQKIEADHSLSPGEKKAKIAKAIEDKKALLRRAEKILGITAGDLLGRKIINVVVFLSIMLFFESVAQPFKAVEENTGIHAPAGASGHSNDH